MPARTMHQKTAKCLGPQLRIVGLENGGHACGLSSSSARFAGVSQRDIAAGRQQSQVRVAGDNVAIRNKISTFKDNIRFYWPIFLFPRDRCSACWREIAVASYEAPTVQSLVFG